MAGGLNLYQFNGNNPVAYTDPFGLTPCSDLREGIDQAASDLEGYLERYMKHFEQGNADEGHLIAVEGRRNAYDNKMKAYRHMKCEEKERDDHDDWMNGSGGAGALVRWNAQLLPKPQSSKRDHGYTPRLDAGSGVTPGQVTAAGALGAAVVVLRTLRWVALVGAAF